MSDKKIDKTQVEENKEEVQVQENFAKLPEEKGVVNTEVSGEMRKSIFRLCDERDCFTCYSFN